MKIVVPIKLVPDLVEELAIDASGRALDADWLRLKLNELDDHAIEEALLLKEQNGAHMTVIAPDMDGGEDALFTAAAKGADRLVRLTGDFESGVNNHALARVIAAWIEKQSPDLILTGVQAHNDLDGALGPLLAGYLDLPYVGYVSGVNLLGDDKVLVRKEYPGGLIGEMEVSLPAVLGIQAAARPPSYVAFSKIRQAMKTSTLEDQPVDEMDTSGGLEVSKLFQPESTQRAEMIEGNADQAAERLVALLGELGVL